MQGSNPCIRMCMTIALALLAGSQAFGDEPSAPGASLTFGQVVALVLERNPTLKAGALDVSALEGLRQQANLRPNPELEAVVENWGNKNLEGTDARTATFSAGQRLELGGKRSKRQQVAALDKELGFWNQEAARLEVLIQTKKAFAEMLAAQARLSAADEIVALSGQVDSAVSARVAGGKVSPVEETKSRVALALSRLDRSKREAEVEAARRRLAAFWGETMPVFERVEGHIESTFELPTVVDLTSKLEGNPDIRRWITERKQRQAALKLEKSLAIPDPTVAAGVRRFALADETAFTFSVSIPIPLFDRNQGAVAAAQYQTQRAEQEERAVRLEVHARLAETYARASSALEEIRVLQADTLPSAQTVFDRVSEGYRLGKFGYLDVLDAQRTLIEAKMRLVDSLAGYHTGIADLQRLIGVSVDEIPAFDSALFSQGGTK